MTEISGDHRAERDHCDAFLQENADLEIRRPAHIFMVTPLDRLAIDHGRELLSPHKGQAVMVRRSLVTIITRQASFDVWAALACLEDLLSDYRRIAPRYSFVQTAGEASIAVGNKYRLMVSDPELLGPISVSCDHMASGNAELPTIKQRVMDVRVIRAGPWGGETGELVLEALRNHALAGASSLWILAHDESDDGALRVTLDALEVARWAWAPDFLANQQRPGNRSGARIIDWDYLFERLAQTLDGLPEATLPDAAFAFADAPDAVARDDRVQEALHIHTGLKPFFEQLS